MPLRRLLPFLCAFLLAACDGGSTGLDGGEQLQPPELSSVTPSSGPQAGGTVLTVRGSNFQEGARVYFGATEAASVAFVSRAQLTATTAASTESGKVDVRVTNRDGQSDTLPLAFTYEKAAPRAIVQSVLLNPALKKDVTGAAMVPVAVTAEVEISGATAGKGQATGVRAQVGYKVSPLDPSAPAGVTWVDATYLADADGTTPGDLARDRYEATVNLPGAAGTETKDYVLAARFSIDNGATWVLADRDGSANGSAADQLPHVTVARPAVDWCKLGGESVDPPPEVALRVGQTGPTLYAQVWKDMLTSKPDKGAGISGQIGYGPVGSDPSMGGWTWSEATYNKDTGGGANDEYSAVLPNPGAGTFAFAFRFSVSGGPYLFCDANGSDMPGYTADQAGKLTVTPVDVDSCKLVPPATYLAPPNTASGLLAARVVATTVTDAQGKGAGITGELGYGPAGSQPGAGWTWVAATYASDQDGTRADEYRARVPAIATAGNYDVAFRFHYTGRPDVLCDLDGSENGYLPAQSFKLKIATASISGCYVTPLVSGTVASGAKLSVWGRVKVPGITDGAGAGVGIRGQVGVGSAGTNASSSPWAWKDAIYVGDPSTPEDELRGDIQPAYTGSRAVSFRFSLNNGDTWTYCDLNGSDVGGYEVAQQPALTVTNHADLDFCNLQFPDSVSNGTTDIYGRFYEPGVSDPPGEPADVVAELGYGPEVEDPGVSSNWRWTAATYNTQSGNDDEYKAQLGPVAAGSYAYGFRFARNLAAPWCYGDKDGHTPSNGFSGGTNLGQATVP